MPASSWRRCLPRSDPNDRARLPRFDELVLSATTDDERTSVPDLNSLVDRARAARVADDDARAYVAELGRWARREPEPRRVWPWWLGGGLALAAAAAIIVLLVRRGPEQIHERARDVAIGAVQIGPRVA